MNSHHLDRTDAGTLLLEQAAAILELIAQDGRRLENRFQSSHEHIITSLEVACSMIQQAQHQLKG